MSDHPSTAPSGAAPGAAALGPPEDASTETFNPWSVVNLVFHHLADEGLHPVLGATGDPGGPAAELLGALGITPTIEGNRRVSQDVHDRLAELRVAFNAGQESAGGSGQQSAASR